MNDEPQVSGTGPEEDALIGQTPAVYANKVYLTAVPEGFKLTFAEQYPVGGTLQSKERFAVFMLLRDFLSMFQLLEKNAQNIEKVVLPVSDPQDDG